jgi:signal transduction histidine kinase
MLLLFSSATLGSVFPLKLVALSFAIGTVVGLTLVFYQRRRYALPLEQLTLEITEGRKPSLSPAWPKEVQSLSEALRAQRRTLKHVHRRAPRMVEVLAEGIILADNEGEPILHNPSAEKAVREAPPWLERHLHPGKKISEKIEWQDQHLLVRSGQLSSRDRMVVLSDVSDFERLDRKRRDFVANASHELRTPVTALVTLLEALEMGAKEDPQRRDHFLARASQQVKRLHSLTHDLLDLTRAERGLVESTTSPVTEICQNLAGEVEPLLASKEQRLQLDLVAGLDWELPSKSATRMLRCLVENAIEFSPTGATVVLSASAQDDELTVEVIDAGPGIPEEYLDRVFERFFRVQHDRGRKSGGAGLGLSIARHLATDCGGNLELVNRPEGGLRAIFRCSIP